MGEPRTIASRRQPAWTVVQSGLVADRPDPEGRPDTQPLGRRAITQDQLPDRPGELGTLELLGETSERPLADRHPTPGISLQVGGPVRTRPGGHQDGAIRLFHEADVHPHDPPGPSTAGLDRGHGPPGSELLADVHRSGPRRPAPHGRASR